MLTSVIASAFALLALPAGAAAHHSRHHGRHAHKHHATSARVVIFGARSAAGPTSTSPTSPGSGDEAAGKVVTFEGGVLTIALSGGSQTVSGKVTEKTELRCQPATPPGESGDDQREDEQGSSVQSGEQDEGSGSGDFASGHGDFMARSADFRGDDAQDEGDDGQEACTTAALTPGTVVLEAELELTGSGAVWEKLDIVH
jgi:hypothetical protein